MVMGDVCCEMKDEILTLQVNALNELLRTLLVFGLTLLTVFYREKLQILRLLNGQIVSFACVVFVGFISFHYRGIVNCSENRLGDLKGLGGGQTPPRGAKQE